MNVCTWKKLGAEDCEDPLAMLSSFCWNIVGARDASCDNTRNTTFAITYYFIY